MRIEARDQALQIAAGSARASLEPSDFICASNDELRLAREATSQIQAPPLIDQTRTTSYVLRGGRDKDLVLSTYTRTTAKPYGFPLTGPLQLQSTTTWTRKR